MQNFNANTSALLVPINIMNYLQKNKKNINKK